MLGSRMLFNTTKKVEYKAKGIRTIVRAIAPSKEYDEADIGGFLHDPFLLEEARGFYELVHEYVHPLTGRFEGVSIATFALPAVSFCCLVHTQYCGEKDCMMCRKAPVGTEIDTTGTLTQERRKLTDLYEACWNLAKDKLEKDNKARALEVKRGENVLKKKSKHVPNFGYTKEMVSCFLSFHTTIKCTNSSLFSSWQRV